MVRRWSITLSRRPDTGRYGLGLNEGNEVTVAPEVPPAPAPNPEPEPEPEP